jgi:hypothetical protein
MPESGRSPRSASSEFYFGSRLVIFMSSSPVAMRQPTPPALFACQIRLHRFALQVTKATACRELAQPEMLSFTKRLPTGLSACIDPINLCLTALKLGLQITVSKSGGVSAVLARPAIRRTTNTQLRFRSTPEEYVAPRQELCQSRTALGAPPSNRHLRRVLPAELRSSVDLVP